MTNKRIRMVAGNWKMHTTYEGGRILTQQVIEKMPPSDVQVVLCPPFTHLKNTAHLINGVSNLSLGAQNCHESDQGAFTGEVAAPMLQSVGVRYVILGHSERREYFKETNAQLAKKVDQVLKFQMRPIFCCGEKQEVREQGEHVNLVESQLHESLFHLSAEEFSRVVIAYEPVWAIGTGQNATSKQVQEMHFAIRQLISQHYGEKVAAVVPILYGGSVRPANAGEIFSQPDVDGGLIGGASLKAEEFVEIVRAAQK